MQDQSEAEFRDLFKLMCPKMGIELRNDVLDYLIETHYLRVKRPFRCCQPRDLLAQVRNLCLFKNVPPEMSREFFDFAVENYFAVM